MLTIIKGFSLILLFCLAGCEENQFTDVIDEHWIKKPEVCDVDNTAVSFKKVAHWSPDESDNLELVDFSMLTHIIYSAINVNADGSLVLPVDSDEDTLEDMVSYAQTAGIKVLVSLGDGNDNNFNSIASNTTTTNNFVDDVVDFIDEYELDGIELNWQTIGDDDESDNLQALLEELQEAFNEDGTLLVMSAPSGEYTSANNINNELFAYVDFVNVMAFDSTDSDDLHSSLEDAQESIAYWTGRCLIKNKLVLGVPFYSRGNAIQSYDYLIRDDINYACVDESERRDYNGIPTMIDKTNYAMLYAGGMMMKSLEQDIYVRNSDDNDDPFVINNYSLLNTINETSNGTYVDICD